MILKLVKGLKHLRFINTPGLWRRVINGYFHSLILRQEVLRSIELAITYNCQLNCHKCYAKNLADPSKRPLSVEQIQELFKQAWELGLIHINITGGEPLLRPDLFDIIKVLKPDKMMISLVTNGLLLNEETVARLAQSGLNTIQISLDSAIPEIHDRLRGAEGCFERAVDGAKLARKYGINVCFSTVLSTEESSNEDAIKRLVDFGASLDIFVLICDSGAVGGWEGCDDKVMNCHDRDEALTRLLRHPYARHHTLYNFRGKSGCPAGTEKIYVTAYGDITPCDLIHEPFGNVLEEPLKIIWERMYTDPRFSQKTSHCVRYLPGGLEENL
jgi:MoaA/NifB/PqqE/SkfB family radical SAM enzyme